MARGFGLTRGVAATDRVTITNYAAIADLSTISVFFVVNRNGAGADFGRVFQKATGLEVLNRASDGNFHLVAGRWATTDGEWRFSRGTNSVDEYYLITYDHGATTNVPAVYRGGTTETVTLVTTPAGALGADGDLLLGNRTAADRVIDGTISEFAIWNRLLTAGEGLAMTGAKLSPLAYPRGLVYYDAMIRDLVNRVAGNAPTATGTAVQPHPAMRYPSPARVVGKAAAGGGGGGSGGIYYRRMLEAA